MSDWEMLVPTVKPAPADTPCRLILHKPKRQHARGTVLLARFVVEQLFPEPPYHCHIRVGKGARRHQISILADLAGQFRLSPVGTSTKTYRAWLPTVPSWADMPMNAIAMKFTFEEEAKKKILILDLPAQVWNTALPMRAIA